MAPAIFFPGMLTGDAKWGALYGCDAFVLTSHQENFGIAVAEALACGKPVLISNQINIWREIAEDGAGLVTDDTQAGADQLLEKWAGLAPEARAAMGRAAKASYENRFGIVVAAQSLLASIERIVAEKKK
jgi:glycosyltransferase involved in cell wall biosynthesis